jgi:16S rRNA (cytosine967-C5)-methyltransferase
MQRAYAHSDQALALWSQWLAAERPWQLDRFLADALKADRRLGRRDRMGLSEAVFTLVRYGSLARRLLAPKETGITGVEDLRRLPADRLLAIAAARYGREQWPLRGVEKFTLGSELGQAFSRLENDAMQAGDAGLDAFLAWHGLDAAWLPALQARAAASGWDDAALRAFVVAQTTRPPLWLRLNHAGRREPVLEELRGHYAVEVLDDAVAVRGARGIHDLACWKSGDIEVQDFASQQVGVVVAPAPGEVVWDACAGAGGKSLQLAVAMGGRGAVHASDLRTRALDETARRARRAGLHNIRSFVWHGEEVPPFTREVEKRGGYDAVLVDAPCSASGTWRRNPDARYRIDDARIAELTELQRRLLHVAAQAVRPGGRLVYSTCSVLCQENEAVVAAFLADTPGFALDVQGMHGCPAQDSDAMFVARLHRAC